MESRRLMHIITIKQFLDRSMLSDLFAEAEGLKQADAAGSVAQVLSGKIVATLFYEPSTRTRFSFESATLKQGGHVISTEAALTFSSAPKGETLADTVRVVGVYADAIVLRHPEKGSAAEAAEYSPVPVINAGDGAGEHPTQALLDAFTIQSERGSIDGLHIAVVGDLLYGRTVHSLLPLLAVYDDVTVHAVAPKELQLPESLQAELKEKGIKLNIYSDLTDVADDLDVLYVTRIQKERFADPAEYDRLKNSFIINEATLNGLSEKCVIMHPLPRVGEIDPAIDGDPRAAYFRQAANGLYMRMALLNKVLL